LIDDKGNKDRGDTLSSSENKQNSGSSVDIELSGGKQAQSEVDSDGSKVFVYMNRPSYNFIYDYSLSDTSQELGGVLIGNFNEKDGVFYVNVEAAIEARYTDAARASVTFTHKTWDYINEVREEKYPECRVVGWFHTHPGFGIFLSGNDKFIHQNFFNLPWQVAYVVDPIAEKHGFFGWHDGNLAKLPFKTESSPQTEPSVQTQEKMSLKKPFAFWKVASVGSIFLLLVALGYLYLSIQETNQHITELEASLSRSHSVFNEGQEKIMETEAELELLQSKIDELEKKLEQETSIDQHADQSYIEHTVEEGESLSSISDVYLGDENLYTVLAEINNIENPDQLSVGQKLMIPER